MKWGRAFDLDAVVQDVLPMLYRQETLNCLLVVLMEAIISGRASSDEYEVYVLRSNADVQGIGVIDSHRRELLLSTMPMASVPALVEQLLADAERFHQMIGPASVADIFARLWMQLHAVVIHHEMSQGVYQATSVRLPPAHGGRFIKADENHVVVVIDFLQAFQIACYPPEHQQLESVVHNAERLVETGRVFLWMDENRTIVSMAAKVRETQNTAGVSLVYTPPKYRNHGYAARLVGHLTALMLKSGKTACMLYTDLTNPTSNGVYLRLGYQRVGDQRLVAFRRRD